MDWWILSSRACGHICVCACVCVYFFFRPLQIYHSKLRKVPIPDMTAVLSVRSATRSKPVRQNQFVRLKRKPYKDDLAKVVEVR